ncbi:MAG: phage minor head protein [Dysgonomonas sp.]|nr:phage minor head protein [Dysgonomonas sp.]
MNIKIVNRLITWGLSKIDSSAIVKEYHNRGKGKSLDYTRQAKTLHTKEIKDFTNSITSATDPDNPRLGDWMRFQEVMKLDGHLMSCVENRILPVQCAPFKLTDDKGNEAPPEVLRLLERPWRLDVAKIICSHTFEGPKLVEMFDLNENGELKKVSEIPQSNFIPQKGIVLDKEYDTVGTSYKEGVYKNYYFQVGEDWNLGLFSQLATIVLAKKLGLGAWLSYIDKYGVPPIFAITERMDSTRRDELFEMLENFRMNHFAVLQGNEKIETPQGYNVDAYNTFKALMTEIADREIEKRIQGSSGLTNEKSFVGAAEIQERILGYRLKVDKLIFQYYFNTEVIPRLVKLSPVYAPLAQYNNYEYDESETLSMKEILEAVKSLSQFFEFDINELKKITGLPITKLKAAISGTSPEPEEELGDNQKKKDKVSGFSLIAPYARTVLPSGGVGLIYAGTWDKAFDELIEKVREGKLNLDDLDKDFILKTYNRLNKAAQNGYGKEYYNDAIARKMRQNLLEFAATKTHIQQREVQLFSDSMEDKKQFEDEARKYLNLQNDTYLDVQVAWAARSAQAARQFQEWLLDKAIYPHVKFRTMMDKDVRPAHAVLEGMVLEIGDPLLDQYMTPLDPRCRCWWEQTRDVLTNFTPQYTPDPQWAGNPGKTGEIFNENNSYNQKVENKEARLQVRRQAELAKEYLPYNRTINVGNNKVHINDFADLSDLEQNIEAARKLAEKLSKDIYIRHHIEGGIVSGHKNPELSIGKMSTLGDLKTYDGESNFINFIKNRLKSANKQGAQYAVLDVSKQSDISMLNRLLSGSLGKQNTNIQRVIIIKGEKVSEITRKQIEKRDFSVLSDII